MIRPRIRTVDLCRYYERGRHVIHAAEHINLEINESEFLALVGASGSGKSTLLNLMAGLDTPTSGHVEVDGVNLASLSRRELSAYRANKIGIIFQSFNLLPNQTALRNVEMALCFTDAPRRERRRRAGEILGRLGLADRYDHKPCDLSGGEQQRVAIARALVKTPEILFADEPTGNLDEDNSKSIIELLSKLNTGGLTVIMVTHNVDTARSVAGRMLTMSYGKTDEDTGSPPPGVL